MIIGRVTELAQQLARAKLRPGDRVLDATAGNGRDSLALAELIGPTGQLWAFDIQPVACAATEARLAAAGMLAQARVICDDHANLAAYGLADLALACFNLGYLPGGDPALCTQPASTLMAVQAAFQALRPGGLLLVAVYHGHPGGREESLAVRGWLQALPAAEAATMEISYPNKQQAPGLLVVEKAARKNADKETEDD